ncbi:unnamed protein product [Heligmosomoides polygyrus]|uniref:Uncharacterized protein n=1 Tax=Heligmosomoides polygyrus TaxID=6339 RepID=A0A183FU67_HELPZ|nr:unnamed protein product [Heligmosomoides polygyrus]
MPSPLSVLVLVFHLQVASAVICLSADSKFGQGCVPLYGSYSYNVRPYSSPYAYYSYSRAPYQQYSRRPYYGYQQPSPYYYAWPQPNYYYQFPSRRNNQYTYYNSGYYSRSYSRAYSYGQARPATYTYG